MTPEQLLREVSLLDVEAAMKLVCRWADDRYCGGEFDLVGELLGQVPLALSPHLLVGLLAFTWCARSQLGESRVKYAERIRPTLEEQLGADRVAQIYSRLGPYRGLLEHVLT